MFTNYYQSAPGLAQDLLWKVLVHDSPTYGRLAWRIVETEAYLWKNDPASHWYRQPTKRNWVMFGPAWYVYVYKIYGMHSCFNITSSPDGDSAATLIRALEPLDWVKCMQKLRKKEKLIDLCNGPAKLFQAMDMSPTLYGGSMMYSQIRIEDDWYDVSKIVQTTRIWLTKGVDLPLRRYIGDNPHVSVRQSAELRVQNIESIKKDMSFSPKYKDSLQQYYYDVVFKHLPLKAWIDKRYAVSADHCFARIVLDTLCQWIWYDYIPKPAINHMSQQQFKKAIEIARRCIDDPDYCNVLNKQSIVWRKKKNDS